MVRELKIKATKIRKNTVEMIHNSKGGHIGGSLSSIDILTTLYFDVLRIDSKNPKKEDRDRFIMSKGHSVEGYYNVLAEAGFFPKEWIETYGKYDSPLAGHPVNKVPGIEVNTGALGHGLNIGVGMAISCKLDKKSYKVYVLMGDGEQAEGSVYEAAIAANHFQLDNLVAIIDRNGLQISGNTEDVMKLENLSQRWSALGWNVIETDGNSIEALLHVFHKQIPENTSPTMIIAKTTKGKGVSFMENKPEWHHKAPSTADFQSALLELENQILQLKSSE